MKIRTKNSKIIDRKFTVKRRFEQKKNSKKTDRQFIVKRQTVDRNKIINEKKTLVKQT